MRMYQTVFKDIRPSE